MVLTSDASIEQLLLVLCDLANLVDLLDTIWAQGNLAGEEINTLGLVERALDEGRLDNVGLAIKSAQNTLRKSCTSHSHGQSSRTGAVLGLDNLVTTKLDAVHEVVELLAGDVTVAGLGDERDNGDTGMATNNDDVLIGRIGALDLGDEAGGTDDIEGGDTEEALGIVDALGLVDFTADGNCRVDLSVN